MLRIRLTRMGSKKAPFYRIVIANSDAPRDGKFKEIVGTYNPMLPDTDPNRITLKKERVDYWISVGAQPSDRVVKLIAKATA